MALHCGPTIGRCRRIERRRPDTQQARRRLVCGLEQSGFRIVFGVRIKRVRQLLQLCDAEFGPAIHEGFEPGGTDAVDADRPSAVTEAPEQPRELGCFGQALRSAPASGKLGTRTTLARCCLLVTHALLSKR
jgi:hypothetical protein